MKYYIIQTLQNYDLKEKFTEYCITNLQEHIDEKSGVSYSKSPSKFAEKYLQRVQIFISKHYNRDYDLSENIFRKNPFKEESAYVQEQYMSKPYRKFLLSFLKDSNIIECDNIYISPNSNFINITKCYGYKISNYIYHTYGFKRKRIKVYKSVLNNYLNVKKRFYNHADPTYLSGMKKMVQELKFNDAQFYADHTFRYDLHLEYQKYCYNQENENFTFEAYNGHRYHTPVTNLKSELRKYLYFDDPLEKNSMVDISNFNGYGLAVYLLNYVYEISDIEKKLLKRFLQTLEHYSRTELVDDFRRVIDTQDIHNVFAGVILGVYFDDADIKQLQKMLNNELILFSVLSLTGIIYEVLSEISGLNRKEVKVEFNKTINYPKGGLLNANGFREFFRNIFPNLVNELVYIHKGSKSDVYYLLTRIETDLMIKNVAPELLNKGIRFTTIHDGIFCKSEDADTIRNTISSEAERLYGFAPIIDVAQMKFDSRDTTNTVESHQKQHVSPRLALVK